MKKIEYLVCLLILLLSCSVSAGMLSDDSILSKPVSGGKLQIGVGVKYSPITEGLNSNNINDPKWAPLSSASIESATFLSVPVTLTYGFLDNLAVRLVAPYANYGGKYENGQTVSGGGLGNLEMQGLYSFLNESEMAPFIGTLLKVKLGTGKKLSDLTINETYAGSRSTDVSLSGIMRKKLGPVTGEMLLGYKMVNAYKEQLTSNSSEFDIKLPDSILYSFGISAPISDQLELAGELWGEYSVGKEKWNVAGNAIEIEKSQRASVMFTPVVKYKVNDGFTVRGSADIIVSKPAVMTLSIPDMYKANTYSLSATMSL